MTDSTPITTKKDDDSAKMRKAYGSAMTRLREAHRDEFNVFQAEEAKKLGIDWKPKATAEEKAAAEVDRLLAAHPSLAAHVLDSIEKSVGDQQTA